MSNYENAYNNKGLSPKARQELIHRQKRDEAIEFTNNNQKGRGNQVIEVVPMKASGKSTATVHDGGVFKGKIHGLHDHFIPEEEDLKVDQEKAIANDLYQVFNQNSPSAGAPVTTNGNTLQGEVMGTAMSVRGGVGTKGITRHIRGGAFNASGMAYGGVGGGDFGVQSLNYSLGGGTAIPNNPSSNSVAGKEFIVNGVKYLSVPSEDAATKAQALRDSAEAAGQAPYAAGKMGKWDGSEVGRKWVTENIYFPVCQKNTNRYKDPEKSAKYFGGKLATAGESYWSSWFFRRCYEAYWDVDSAKRTPGLDSSTVYDYTADQGLAQRIKIEADPDSFVGKILFVTFRSTEAPVFVGDSVWNCRVKPKAQSNKFETLTPKGKQKPSHMKVLARDAGDHYRAIGGNEGKFSTVNDVKVNYDADKKLSSGSEKSYPAVYKRVKVIGKA